MLFIAAAIDSATSDGVPLGEKNLSDASPAAVFEELAVITFACIEPGRSSTTLKLPAVVSIPLPSTTPTVKSASNPFQFFCIGDLSFLIKCPQELFEHLLQYQNVFVMHFHFSF